MNGQQSGVRIPAGIVTIDLYRGMNTVLWWIWTVVQLPIKGPNWVGRIKRDLVISDESGSRELNPRRSVQQHHRGKPTRPDRGGDQS
jgi:hypothetical protein